PWSGAFSYYYNQALGAVLKYCKESSTTPFEDLKESTKEIILHGSGEVAIPMEIEDKKHSYRSKKPFEGVLPSLERRYRESDSPRRREEMSKYQMSHQCEACQGNRLKPEALAVQIA